MKKWKLAWVALSVTAIWSVQVAHAANPVSQQQVNNLFCNSNLPIPSNLCPTSSPTSRNPASQQYVCERYLAVKNQTPSTSGLPVAIGDVVGNGIVYYIDNQQRRGLIAAQTDAPSPAGAALSWEDTLDPTVLIGASGVALFTGTSNTNIIVAALPSTGEAAAAARAYPVVACPSTITCDTSYSLPSLNELSLLFPFNNEANGGYTNIGLVGFVNDGYWTSTEANAFNAWVVDIRFGTVFNTPKTSEYRVRPVRAFTY